MSHEIVDQQIAWAGQVPWHGLGMQMDPDADPADFLKAAKLDWEVESHPIFAYVNGEQVEIPNRKAYMRSTDNKLYGIASPGWTPVQNSELIEFMVHYTKAGNAQMEVVGALKDGQTIWGLAKLKHKFEVRPGDVTEGFLLISGSHVPGTSTKVATSTIRVVCQNTMAASAKVEDVHYRQSHAQAFDVEKARESIAAAHDEIAAMEKRYKIMDKIKLSAEDAVRKVLAPVFLPKAAVKDKEFMDKIMDPHVMPKQIQQIMNSINNAPGAIDDTGYGVLQGISHYFDHHHGREQHVRFTSSVNGGWATGKKLEAESRILQLA